MDLFPHKKTTKLRHTLRQLRYPTLTQQNQRIADYTDTLHIQNTQTSWDETLENKALTLTTTVRSPSDIDTYITDIQQHNHQLKEILTLI